MKRIEKIFLILFIILFICFSAISLGYLIANICYDRDYNANVNFRKKVSGVWVSSEEYNEGKAVPFMIITKAMEMKEGYYPGEYGRTCEITEIKQKANGSFQTVLYFPEVKDNDMYGYMPEMKKKAVFDSLDNYGDTLKITYDDGTQKEYVFIAEDFETATSELDLMFEEKAFEYYDNSGSYERTKFVDRILQSIENTKASNGKTYSEYIYALVEDKYNCYIKEDNPRNAVLIFINNYDYEEYEYMVIYNICVGYNGVGYNEQVTLTFLFSSKEGNLKIMSVGKENGKEYNDTECGQSDLEKIFIDYVTKCINNYKGNNSNYQNTVHIPMLSFDSKYLGKDFDVIRKRMGGSLMGPSANYCEFAKSWLYLKDIDKVNCYKMSSSPPHELLGVDSRGVAFWGMFGMSSMYVKDFLDDNALMIEPAIYPIKDGSSQAFIWKLKNGYLVINTMSMSSVEWYNRPATGVVHVRDVNHISFFN